MQSQQQPGDFVSMILNVERDAAANAKKAKQLTQQKNMLMDKIQEHMASSGQSSLTLPDGRYIVLVTKQKPLPLDLDVVGASLQEYMATQGVHWNDDKIREFLAFMKQWMESRSSGEETSVKIVKRVPTKKFISKN